ALIILLPTPVGACQAMQPTIYITCGGWSVYVPTDRFVSPSQNVDQELQVASKKLDELTPYCGVANVTALKTIFEPYYRRWLNGEVKRVNQRIELYSTQREAELVERQNNITECSYQDFAREGNWLFLTYQQRDYCNSGYCLTTFISPSKFLGYVITNPSWRTLPYLVGFAIAADIVVIGWMAFLRQHISRLRKLIQLLLIWIVLAVIGFTAILFDGSFTLGLEIVSWSLVALVIAVILTLRQRSKATVEVQPNST
ncbi:MAG: hypothetical protein KF726_17805, partial [Anaerolineae bacterium]|nr:hypothetical protein [Anaerolineae bacterium]